MKKFLIVGILVSVTSGWNAFAGKPSANLSHAQEAMSSSDNMMFVKIPAGQFIMGSNSAERTGINAYEFDDETPHQVTITRDFEIQTTPVTQGEVSQFIPNYSTSSYASYGNGAKEQCPENFVSFNYPNFPDAGLCPDHPQIFTYDEAIAFVTALNAEANDGYTYRLPTEAEWEYAARAGTTTTYFFGNDSSLAGQYISPSNEDYTASFIVGSKAPNPWGLYDVLDIGQWVSDFYGPYPKNAVVDPTGPQTGSDHVYRGAIFWSIAYGSGGYGGEQDWTDVRSAARGATISEGHAWSTPTYIGLRLVRTEK